jgi:NADPH:quinone reductase-like Zn-dependent oxidoreductase
MSQLILTAVGGDVNDTVYLEKDPDLTLGPDDLLVAMEAAPINPADFLLASGWYGVQPRIPSALGAEGVGRVLEAGSAADRGLVGRRVLILPTYEQGTWSDRVVVPARNVVVVGDTADALQLAMLPVNPATAHILLNRYVSLKPGDWICLTLGNSAVGQYVIALAKRAGVKTLAVVRREEAAGQLRALGADHVIVDGEHIGDRIAAALDGARFRLVLDGIGGPEVAELARSLEFGGTVVSFSAVTGQSPVLPLADLIYREISLHGLFVINWVRDAPRQEIEETYAELAGLVEQGVLTAAVEATYPIERYREALAHAQRPKRSGKVLFTFEPTAP